MPSYYCTFEVLNLEFKLYLVGLETLMSSADRSATSCLFRVLLTFRLIYKKNWMCTCLVLTKAAARSNVLLTCVFCTIQIWWRSGNRRRKSRLRKRRRPFLL